MSLSLVSPDANRNHGSDKGHELADAICDKAAADARAKIAKDTFDRAEHARCEAAAHADRLKAERDAARARATERQAKTIADAFRGGSDLPAGYQPDLPDTAASSAAMARLDALTLAAHILAAERDKAADACALAASTVASIVSAIMEADARQLAAEESAAFEAYWKIRDRLAGFVRIHETALADIADDMARGLNRQARLARKDPLLMEPHHWMDHLDKIATGAERKWRAYSQRLTLDATSRFSEESSQ